MEKVNLMGDWKTRNGLKVNVARDNEGDYYSIIQVKSAFGDKPFNVSIHWNELGYSITDPNLDLMTKKRGEENW